jgi:hypothetical protein
VKNELGLGPEPAERMDDVVLTVGAGKDDDGDLESRVPSLQS